MIGAPGYQRFAQLAVDERRLLQERARALAAQRTEQTTGERIETLLVQAAGQLLALPIENVLGVVELSGLAPVPRAPPLVRGLVSFRGEILVGIEAGALVGSGNSGIADLRRVVALGAPAGRLALLAERVHAAETMDRASFTQGADAGRSWAAGVNAGFVTLVDVAELVASAWRTLGGGR
ncbi:MAG: chemotaxis protein CheW [Myxococcales bacterium]